MLSPEKRQELILRLRRIEGQTQGIQRMLAENRPCEEVLNQLASVRAATRMVSLELLRGYLASRLAEPEGLNSAEAIEEMINTLLRV